VVTSLKTGEPGQPLVDILRGGVFNGLPKNDLKMMVERGLIVALRK
jgi:hypothetical protein